MEKAPMILVTDDSRLEREFLAKTLREEGYQVQLASSGEEALASIRREPPDLILLDVIMPGLDGMETCRAIRAEDALRAIPIVFLTARTDEQDKVEGLRSGAVDYITKPFRTSELLARVATQIELKRLRDQVADYANHLEQNVQELTRQLLHADRLSSLGVLAAGIVHEVNNPNAFIRGNLQVLKRFLPHIQVSLEQSLTRQVEERTRIILDELPRMIDSMLEGSHRIDAIGSLVKRGAYKGSAGRKPCNLVDCLRDALDLTHNRLKYNVRVHESLPASAPIVADPRQITQVFTNVLINAGDALGQQGGDVWIEGAIEDHEVAVRVRDNGPGVPEEIRHRIFDYFFTTKDSDQGTGLGLPISRKIMEDHGGQMHLTARTDGAEFVVRIPLAIGAEQDPGASETAAYSKISRPE